MMIKNHKKLDNLPIRGIPFVRSYYYLGVDIDQINVGRSICKRSKKLKLSQSKYNTIM